MAENTITNGVDQPVSPQERIRQATISDVPRIAVVATAGFYDAPQFAWERPYHHQHPNDTYSSYVDLFRTRVSDPGCLCYLVEDEYDPRENEKSGATIATGDLYQRPQSSDLVPVGVAIWRLPKDSHRHSGATSTDPETEQRINNHLATSSTRDVNGDHRAQLRSRIPELSSKHFGASDEKFYAMMMFVVHPAYHGRGHGTLLLQRGAAYADADQRAIRLFSQPKAVPLYQRGGFEILERHFLEDGEERFDFAAMIRWPQRTTET